MGSKQPGPDQTYSLLRFWVMMGTPDSTSRSARDGVEDVIPDDSLVLLVGTATGSVDGEDADIISSKTLDGEGTTKRSN